MAKEKKEPVLTLNGFEVAGLKFHKKGYYTGKIDGKKFLWEADGRLNASHPDLYDLNTETIK